MIKKTYLFQYRNEGGKQYEDAVNAVSKDHAYLSIQSDERFKRCFIIKSSIKLVRDDLTQ